VRDTNTDKIRTLNDCFRRSLVFGGQTVPKRWRQRP
jgi:hypothetical protein